MTKCVEVHDLCIGFLSEMADEVDDAKLEVYHAKTRAVSEVIVIRTVRNATLDRQVNGIQIAVELPASAAEAGDITDASLWNFS